MNLIIFDLETTGLSPANHEMIQIAAVRLRPGTWEMGDRFESFVRPRQPVPSFISRLTGITQRHVDNAPAENEALHQFSRFIGDDATLVAHNGIRFDMAFIRHACHRHQLPVRETAVLDTLHFSRKLWGGRSGHGLDAVLSRLGLSHQNTSNGMGSSNSGHPMRRHDARTDVHLLAHACRTMWEKLSPGSLTSPVEKATGVIPCLS